VKTVQGVPRHVLYCADAQAAEKFQLVKLIKNFSVYQLSLSCNPCAYYRHTFAANHTAALCKIASFVHICTDRRCTGYKDKVGIVAAKGFILLYILALHDHQKKLRYSLCIIHTNYSFPGDFRILIKHRKGVDYLII
jgi:hypothetical protein